MTAAVAMMAALGLSLATAAGAALPEDARLEPLPFESLPGWTQDDHAAALAVFRAGCAPILAGYPGDRPGLAAGAPLLEACRAAMALPQDPAAEAARAFFEARFLPYRVMPSAAGRGFFTAYYEPEIEGRLSPEPPFTAAILSRPADLVSFRPEERPGAIPPPYEAARHAPDGTLSLYPDRAAIEGGALVGLAEPIVHLEPVDAFFVHVQGSARVRLPGGEALRLAYAGRNGHPFTAIGRLLVERGVLDKATITADAIKDWLRADPGAGADLMRENASYIFFALNTETPPALGPKAAAGVPLTAERSLAVDRAIWPYGIPVYVDADLPRGGLDDLAPFRRLMVAQDTGSAIVGPARADLFMGTGDAAGRRAGRIRHPGSFIVFLPRPDAAP